MKFNQPRDVAYDVEVALGEIETGGESAESMFRALVEKSNDIILITGRDFVIRYITGSVEKLLGVKPEQILGKELFEFVTLAKAKALKEFVETGKFKEDRINEVDFVTVRGERKYFDVTISNLLNSNKVNGVVVNLHDITQRKLTEEKLRKANNELDHFIYKTSHDLRAPLLSAIGLVELAARDPEGNQEQYLSMIKQSLHKLDGFIEDINAFYRNEKLAVRNEQIDIELIIKDEIENLRGAEGASSKIDIQYEITMVSELRSDAMRLKTVITNILSNAIKYSDFTKPSPGIQISVHVTPDECRIVVEDNGIGIRSKYLDFIFDIFYRADDNAKGSGLGLYIVKDTVDKLNGQVKVTSEYGKGSAFTILIPNFLNSMKKLDYNK